MFRLRKDARDWFRHLHDFSGKRRGNKLPVGFDVFYFCLIAGLATGQKKTIASDQATDLVNYFPDDYKPRGRLIVALFLSRELESLGISLTNRIQLHSNVQRLVDPLSPSQLSPDGIREMNRYAHGGFDVLSDEWFESKPRSLETFLPLFTKYLARGLRCPSKDNSEREDKTGA